MVEPVSAPASASLISVNTTGVVMTLFGYHVNVMALAIMIGFASIAFLFFRIQRSKKLDFADMITKDGRAVSLTKVLQLVGGMTSTWIMVKLTLAGGLTEAILGIYLAYVAGVEGYSKYVSAKYNYSETSVRDATALSSKPLKSTAPPEPDEPSGSRKTEDLEDTKGKQ